MFNPRTPVRFRYLTIQDLRDNGIPATALDDDAAIKAIENVSNFINILTDQWFSPLYLEQDLDGSDHRFLTMPNLIPFLEVSELQSKSGGLTNSSFSTISKDGFDMLERALDRKSSGGGLTVSTQGTPVSRDSRWISSSSPYRLKGYLGNLNLTKGFGPEPTKLASELITAPLAIGDTSAEVADITDFEVGDAVLIGKKISVIVTAITPTVAPAGTIEFDKISQAASVGDEVVTFGRIHDGIKRATLILVNQPKNKFGINSPNAALGNKAGRLLSERTDNYSYKLSNKTTDSTGEGGHATSGNLEADNLLNEFMAPPFIGTV